MYSLLTLCCLSYPVHKNLAIFKNFDKIALFFWWHYAQDIYIWINSLYWGQRLIEISGSLIWSRTLMEFIFNPCGEFRWSPEGTVSQIHSPHLHVGAPGIFSDLLRSVQMLKREWGVETDRKLPHLFNPW